MISERLRWLRPAAISLFFGCVGCATVPAGLRATVFRDGQPDPDEDDRIVELAENGGRRASAVTVYSGKLPQGLELTESGSKLIVEKGFESHFQVLGTAESDFTKGLGSGTLNNLFWTWNYKEGWRKALCYWQVPLKIATIGVWNLIPLQYPCIATLPSQEKDRQKVHLANLRSLAVAMGGNMVVLSGKGGLQISTVNTKTGAVLSTGIEKDISMTGYVIKYTK